MDLASQTFPSYPVTTGDHVRVCVCVCVRACMRACATTGPPPPGVEPPKANAPPISVAQSAISSSHSVRAVFRNATLQLQSQPVHIPCEMWPLCFVRVAMHHACLSCCPTHPCVRAIRARVCWATHLTTTYIYCMHGATFCIQASASSGLPSAKRRATGAKNVLSMHTESQGQANRKTGFF